LLHADPLGSTALTTNGSGTTLDDHGYYAYGKDRRGSELHTTQRFTGQQGDATGLLYYGARYYDPQLGQFISPDTLVPDATNLFDYNRYMYARGNPMKYNDPTGHCSSNKDGSPAQSDAECWKTVGIITLSWDQDPTYWNGIYGNQDDFLKNYAQSNDYSQAYMLKTLSTYVGSDSFKTAMGLPTGNYTPNPVVNPKVRPFGAIVVDDGIECSHGVTECGKALDDASTALSITAKGCLMVGAAPCAAAAGGFSTIVSVAGTGLTVYNDIHQKASTKTIVVDATVNLVTTGVGWKWGTGYKGTVGVISSVVQWVWDH